MDGVKFGPILSKRLINKFELGVPKLQLSLWCKWLWKVLRLCNMSSLQDGVYQLDRVKSGALH